MTNTIDDEMIYTADDEEPQCQKCDNLNAPDAFCINTCGGGHGWYGYQRTEVRK